jgi:rhodanese-related sulfurtransferase
MLLFLAVILSVWMIAGPATAQTGETPPTLDGVTTITSEQAKDLLAKGAKVFDFRRKTAYADGHIPGAVSGSSAYNADTKLVDAAVFGANKDQAIIIHGHGSDGWTAVAAAKSAAAAGFKNVNWLRAGWAEWQAKGFPVEQ